MTLPLYWVEDNPFGEKKYLIARLRNRCRLLEAVDFYY
jgi:hypothetical protein